MATKINLDEQIPNIDGKPILDEKMKPVTVGKVAGSAVFNKRAQGQASEQVADYVLATKLYTGGEIELDAEEVVSLRKSISESGMSIIMSGFILQKLEVK